MTKRKHYVVRSIHKSITVKLLNKSSTIFKSILKKIAQLFLCKFIPSKNDVIIDLYQTCLI